MQHDIVKKILLGYNSVTTYVYANGKKHQHRIFETTWVLRSSCTVLVYQTFLRSLLPMIQQSFVDWHQKWGNGSLLLRLLLFRSLLEIAFFLLLLPLLSLFKLFLEEAAAVANERRRVFSNSYFFFWGGEELLLRLYPTLRKLAWAQKRDLVLLRRKTAKLITWHEDWRAECRNVFSSSYSKCYQPIAVWMLTPIRQKPI